MYLRTSSSRGCGQSSGCEQEEGESLTREAKHRQNWKLGLREGRLVWAHSATPGRGVLLRLLRYSVVPGLALTG
jgi:hypothetical protein